MVFILAIIIALPAISATIATTVTSSSQLLDGPQADGQIGDLLLSNDHIAIIISAVGHITHNGENGGTVIDAGTQTVRTDALGELYTYFDDDWPRQAVYTSLTITDDGTSGGLAVIRAEGYDLNNSSMTVATEYSLADGDKYLSLTTWVTGGGSIQPNFELGDAFQWGSCDPYAPGYGFSVSGTTTQAWMAGRHPEVCYAYAGIYGDNWGPNGNGWSDLSVTTETLDPAIPVAYTRYLAVAGGDIGTAVSILNEALGIPTGTLICNVSSQADGSPLPGGIVDIFDGSGSPYLQTIVNASGQTLTALPTGDWRVQASASGYMQEESWVTVYEGATHALDFMLEPSNGGGGEAIGDTLTVIQKPLANIPTILTPGQTLEINCDADPATTGWQAEIFIENLVVNLTLNSAVYDPTTEWWTLSATMPQVSLFDLFDLKVTADGGLEDKRQDAVQVLQQFRNDYYFVHITDVHLPEHMFSDSGATPADSSEIVDLREVIEDLNVINPEFVLITGDYINEGELEDYMEWRAYTRAQRMLYEFEVPTFLVSGNHDIGGWSATPPPDGTARRDWWRFFGWKRLNDPPPGAPMRTQNYSFDYGPIHYVGMESYNNYDRWREEIYGSDSFISEQITWLNQDLAAASGSQAQVLFYHKDFQKQLNLNALGVEMALWGHVHSDNGDLEAMPFDISTDNVCDGQRSYRVIRVSGGTLQPQATISAGAAGQNLTVAYTPPNAGLSSTVTAQVTNNQPLRFENGRLKFVMPSNNGKYVANGGQVVQIDQSGEHDVVYVAVDIPANGNTSVTVEPDLADVPGAGPGRGLFLAQNQPNPFNPSTELKYHLPQDGPARLSIYDMRGREVAVLVDEVVRAGENTTRWSGQDKEGRHVPSGVYLVRLVIPGEETTRKITLAR
jgi:predicted MPP superfamily phosphohydrolase